MKGKTTSGFEFKLTKERLENYELVEALSRFEDEPLYLSKVVSLLLGKEQTEKLKDHLRDEEGLISTELLTNEIKEIFESQNSTKNS